jgi:hypothetical protein
MLVLLFFVFYLIYSVPVVEFIYDKSYQYGAVVSGEVTSTASSAVDRGGILINDPGCKVFGEVTSITNLLHGEVT